MRFDSSTAEGGWPTLPTRYAVEAHSVEHPLGMGEEAGSIPALGSGPRRTGFGGCASEKQPPRVAVAQWTERPVPTGEAAGSTPADGSNASPAVTRPGPYGLGADRVVSWPPAARKVGRVAMQRVANPYSFHGAQVRSLHLPQGGPARRSQLTMGGRASDCRPRRICRRPPKAAPAGRPSPPQTSRRKAASTASGTKEGSGLRRPTCLENRDGEVTLGRSTRQPSAVARPEPQGQPPPPGQRGTRWDKPSLRWRPGNHGASVSRQGIPGFHPGGAGSTPARSTSPTTVG